MEPSLNLSCYGSSAEYYGACEKNDADHQTDCPGNRHFRAYKITDNTRHDSHEKSGEKIRHRIAVFVYQCKYEIRRYRSCQCNRHHQIDRDLQNTEKVCGNTQHCYRDQHQYGHLTCRSGSRLKLTHDPEFKYYEPHGQQQTPTQVRISR